MESLPDNARPCQRSMSQIYSWLVRTSAIGLTGTTLVRNSPRVPSQRCARCCLLKALRDSRNSSGLDSGLNCDAPIVVGPPLRTWRQLYSGKSQLPVKVKSKSPEHSVTAFNSRQCIMLDRSQLQIVPLEPTYPDVARNPSRAVRSDKPTQPPCAGRAESTILSTPATLRHCIITVLTSTPVVLLPYSTRAVNVYLC